MCEYDAGEFIPGNNDNLYVVFFLCYRYEKTFTIIEEGVFFRNKFDAHESHGWKLMYRFISFRFFCLQQQ